jgi:hypothetical protein
VSDIHRANHPYPFAIVDDGECCYWYLIKIEVIDEKMKSHAASEYHRV